MLKISFHTHFHRKKGILTLVRMGVKFEKQSRQVQTCIYILDQQEKRKLLRKMSVRPSVRPVDRPSVRPCAKVMYTKTQERVEIIECCERCILGIETAKISTRTHEDLRSQSRMKFLTTLLYLGNRLMKSIQTFFILKVWTRK